MSENTQEEAQEILCDMCTEEDRKPAKKTCMKCEISMCVQHLQAHLTTPVLLQTHPLTEPMALGGTTKCPQHGKLLEYYCLDDKTCVCVSCAIEDKHRVHNMKTFSTAHEELMEKLSTELKELQVNTDDKNESLEQWDKSEREKVANSSVRLIDAVTHLRDIALTSVKSSVSARMVSIRTSKSSIQAAQNEKDTFRFLQMYSQVDQDVEKAKAVDLRKGLEPGSDRDKLIQEINQKAEEMVKQAGHLWGSLLTLVEPENHQELTATASDLEFYTHTSCPTISFSKDKRKVFYHSWMGPCSLILHIQSNLLESNIQRWVVNLSQDSDWIIGLCDNEFMQNSEAGYVFGLCCQDNKLRSLTTERAERAKDTSQDFGQGFGFRASTQPHPGFGTAPFGATQNKGFGSVFSFGGPAQPQPSFSTGFNKLGTTQKTGGLFGSKSYRQYNEVFRTKSTRLSSPLDHKPHGCEAAPRPETVEVVCNREALSLSFYSITGQHQREEIITMKTISRIQQPFVLIEKNNDKNMPQGQWQCSCGTIRLDGPFSFGSASSTHCSCGRLFSELHLTEMLCEFK